MTCNSEIVLNKNIKSNKTKKIYIEILRCIAIFLVIFNHTGLNGFQLYARTSNEILYIIYLALAIICKIAVPIFFMISGALLLKKEESIKEIYKKRVLRIVVVIIIASFFQYIWEIKENFTEFSIKEFFVTIYSKNIVSSYWFLYAYLGFLITLPFLRSLVKNMKKEYYYYLFALYIFYILVVPIVREITDIDLYSQVKLGIFTTNIIAPIAGYFCENILRKEKINKKVIIIGTIIVITIIAVAEILTRLEIKDTGNKRAQTYLSYGTILIAIYVYMLIKLIFENKKLPKLLEKAILIIGSCSFGVYLIERNIRELIFEKMILTLSPMIKNMPACIITILTIILIGTIITMILKKIPYVKKIL